MTSRELVIQTLNHGGVDRVPRDLDATPDLERRYGDEVAEMNLRYPSDVQRCSGRPSRGRLATAKPDRSGQFTDAWGCTWLVARGDAPSRIERYPLSDAEQMAGFRPPLELLDCLKPARINRGCAGSSRFILADSETWLYERLQALRGPEAARKDLANGTRAVRRLLAALHEFSCEEMLRWAACDVDGVALGGGGLHDVPPPPASAWRNLLKPLYAEYCRILHDADKFVFFRVGDESCAHVADLIEVGVDAIGMRLDVDELEQLAEAHRGQITFWAEIDVQGLLAVGTPRDCRKAVRRIRKALDFGCGGLVARCRWDVTIPFQNVAAVMGEWCQPLPACF
jgi:hypothetical protein